MGRIGVALRAFFGSLMNRETAERVAAALAETAVESTKIPAPAKPAKPEKPEKPAKPVRNDAVLLLCALQRDARFVDFLMEPLDDFTDQQIGAAARDVHRGSRATVQRMFGVEPLLTETEGATVEVPAPLDPDRFRLVGDVTGEPPYQGRLAHHGWQATRVELPSWSGVAESTRVLAPAEVELS